MRAVNIIINNYNYDKVLLLKNAKILSKLVINIYNGLFIHKTFEINLFNCLNFRYNM